MAFKIQGIGCERPWLVTLGDLPVDNCLHEYHFPALERAHPFSRYMLRSICGKIMLCWSIQKGGSRPMVGRASEAFEDGYKRDLGKHFHHVISRLGQSLINSDDVSPEDRPRPLDPLALVIGTVRQGSQPLVDMSLVE